MIPYSEVFVNRHVRVFTIGVFTNFEFSTTIGHILLFYITAILYAHSLCKRTVKQKNFTLSIYKKHLSDGAAVPIPAAIILMLGVIECDETRSGQQRAVLRYDSVP